MTLMIHHTWADAHRVASVDVDAFDGYRVLLVGEDNPQDVRPEYALWATPSKGSPGCAGKNLQSKVLGLGHSQYYSLWRTNLCLARRLDDGTIVNGWNRFLAEARMLLLLDGHHPWRTVVCLGRKVTSCAEVATGMSIDTWTWHPWWVETEMDDVHIAIVSIPHPSGLTRDWNDPGSYKRAQDLLAEVEPDVPWGSLGRVPTADEQVGG